MTNIGLGPLIPTWAGYETEVGEIKGSQGLSTPDEALFLIQGLNAHGIFPDWIALNNGTTHGIEATGAGIQVDLTRKIHEALAPYGISGAQHGTSGNNSDRLREIAEQTHTTKANVATALQMIGWGIKVNEYGNAIMENGEFAKVPGLGLSEELYAEIKAYADGKGLKGGDWKKLNLPFERRMEAQTADVRERMAQAVEDFVYDLLVNVFNAKGTGSLAVDMIAEKGSHDMGLKAGVIEDPDEWTEEKFRARAAALDSDKGPQGRLRRLVRSRRTERIRQGPAFAGPFSSMSRCRTAGDAEVDFRKQKAPPLRDICARGRGFSDEPSRLAVLVRAEGGLGQLVLDLVGVFGVQPHDLQQVAETLVVHALEFHGQALRSLAGHLAVHGQPQSGAEAQPQDAGRVRGIFLVAGNQSALEAQIPGPGRNRLAVNDQRRLETRLDPAASALVLAHGFPPDTSVFSHAYEQMLTRYAEHRQPGFAGSPVAGNRPRRPMP